MANRGAGFVAAGGASASLYDLGYSAALRRSHHDHRLAAVVHSHGELAASLAAFAAGNIAPGVASGVRDPGRPAKLAFVFAGQGPQWWGMARDLLRGEPVFRAAVEECDAILARHAGWSLRDELLADEARSRVHTRPRSRSPRCSPSAWASPRCCRGVEPDAVVGHSVGEAAAAYVAACSSSAGGRRPRRVSRGRLMNRMTGRGRMAALGLTLAEAGDHRDCSGRQQQPGHERALRRPRRARGHPSGRSSAASSPPVTYAFTRRWSRSRTS